MNPNLQGAAFMTASMASFTLNDAVVKLITQTVPLFQFVFIRGAVTAALIAGIAMLLGGLSFRIPKGDRGKVLLRTLFEICAMIAFLSALVNMPIANATAILSALPLAVTVGAALVFGEQLGWRRLTAIAIGAFGVLMIVQPGLEGFNIFSLWALAAVFFVTCRDLVTRAFSDQVPSMGVAVITAAAVSLVGGVLSLNETWVAFGQTELFYLGLASVLIIGGYIFSILVMRVGEVGAVAPFRYSALVFALILGVVVFDEFPNALALLGAAIVVALDASV